MYEIFSALPGAEVPVNRISAKLAEMWETVPDVGRSDPSEFRASQMNLVLHFGMRTTPDDARAQFDTAVRFSQRYPCRVIVLCPERESTGEPAIRAKLHSACHVGKSRGEKSCCEFVLLSYSQEGRPYLENQVSVVLESDLPVYYWVHAVASPRKLNDYQNLLRRSKRVIFDRAREVPEAAEFAWPRRESVRDLAYARLLPLRQSLGQFIAGHPAAALVDGLKGVCVEHAPEQETEARVLATWLQAGLVRCGAPTGGFSTEVRPRSSRETSLRLVLSYLSEKKGLEWTANLAAGTAQYDSRLGSGRVTLTTAASLLTPEAALGEALFF